MAATKSYNELTVLIPFLNEGEEVITTVKEVRRTAGYNVNIIVVNDHSTDGYHYEEELKPYQVTYIYNKENYGSAPSRDIAVNKCQTPFFLFLDAHMRFYSFDWAQKIISILKDNDRLILCAQTKALNKNKKGVVYEIKNRETTYGAYMSLINGKFIPDIVWKNSEINPNNETEPIPIVLGAAYAASKRYWKYIKGMSGLKHYGCEEQYMSIKTWLEGGQCILMKNIIIGHIYRNSSPYKLYSETFVYNYLWIASLLFPQTLKCRAFSIAKCNNPIVYKKAKHIFDNNKQLYYRLKSYYQQIFSKEFAIISKLNKDFFDIETSSHAKFDTIISNISSIAEHLKNNIAIENGLLNGKMGQVIWFEQYYKFTGDHLYDNLATEIWEP